MKSLISILPIFCATFLFADGNIGFPSFDELKQSAEKTKDDILGADRIMVSFEEKKLPHVKKSDQVSIDFQNEDIKSVLRYIAELYDLNIIVPNTLTGNVSLRLKDVSWRDLLDAVLSPLQYCFIEKNNIIEISSLKEVDQGPLICETFLLKFADAKTVAKELTGFIDKNLKENLSYNERTNLLIWTGSKKKLEQITDIIKKLDRPESQVMIEAKFVEATGNDSDEFGIQWPSSLTAYIDESSSSDSSSSSSSSTSSSSSSTSSSSDSDTHGQITRRFNNSKLLGSNTLFIQTLSSAFNFSKTESIGKTLSNPTIITMNNVPAKMSVIQTYPIPKYSYNSDAKVYEISGFEEKPVGIELSVTPKVQAEYISLNIEPSLSNYVQDKTMKGSSLEVSYPVISQKKTSSIVTIKSGYSIAIGGLMSRVQKDTRTRTPLLGDLPLLGSFFSNKKKENDLTNLLIFLSATQIAYDGTILYPHENGVKNISERRLFEAGVTKKDLPGEGPISDQEKELYSKINVLQSQLDEVLRQKKANTEYSNLHKTFAKASKVKTHSKGKGRSSKLYKAKQ